jgi:sigma-B regulation protein RsbU (phosphoserine phosphatase)
MVKRIRLTTDARLSLTMPDSAEKRVIPGCHRDSRYYCVDVCVLTPRLPFGRLVLQVPSTIAELDDPDDARMKCMEVWGGNGATNNYLSRPGLDVWIWSQSQGCADAGGGDLHLLSSCASGRITRILLADVCGFGPLFAEFAFELREMMKRNVNSIQQARCVREMSDRLEDASQRGGFASTLISTFFAPNRSLALCNAGHPPPLLFRAQARTWSVLRQAPVNMSSADAHLGVVSRGEYQQFKVKLEVGDMVLSQSNPLTECRSANGGIIGLEGLLSRVRQLDPQKPSNLATKLVTQIRNEHADNLATEDATVLLCRATVTRVAWQDNLLAPFRLLRAVADETRIE